MSVTRKRPAPPPANAEAPSRRWLLLGAALAAGLLVYAVFFWPSAEDEVRDVVYRLESAVRPGADTNPVVRHLSMRKEFSEIFVERPGVRVAGVSEVPTSRDELALLASQVAAAYASSEVSLGDLRVRLAPDEASANVEAVATVTATEHGGRLRRDERKVELRVEKVDGAYRISSLEVAPAAGSD